MCKRKTVCTLIQCLQDTKEGSLDGCLLLNTMCGLPFRCLANIVALSSHRGIIFVGWFASNRFVCSLLVVATTCTKQQQQQTRMESLSAGIYYPFVCTKRQLCVALFIKDNIVSCLLRASISIVPPSSDYQPPSINYKRKAVSRVSLFTLYVAFFGCLGFICGPVLLLLTSNNATG